MTRPVLAIVLSMLAACASVPAHRADLAAVRIALARQSLEARDLNTALVQVQAAMSAAGQTAQGLTLRGIIYRERGMPKDAQADLDEALRLDSKYAPAHNALAVLQDEQRRFDAAEVHHRRALQLDPQNAAYLNDWGHALFLRGKTDEALELLERAVRLDPLDRRFRNNLGFAYARKGDFTRAAQEFETAGPPALAKNNLGVAYELGGNLPRAYDAYLEAVRLDPSLRQGRANLAAVAVALERPVPPEIAASEVRPRSKP